MTTLLLQTGTSKKSPQKLKSVRGKVLATKTMTFGTDRAMDYTYGGTLQDEPYRRSISPPDTTKGYSNATRNTHDDSGSIGRFPGERGSGRSW